VLVVAVVFGVLFVSSVGYIWCYYKLECDDINAGDTSSGSEKLLK